jgi:hypothetical protein
MDSNKGEGPPVSRQGQEDKIRFRPDEMIECGSCGKRNSPNRVACLYCAAILDLPERVHGNLKFRRLESWEKGFNIVIIPDVMTAPETAAATIAELLSVDAEPAARFLKGKRPFPVARLESNRHARSVNESLTARGIRSVTVTDQELADDRPPLRLRGIEFGDCELILFPLNTGGELRIRTDDVELMVSGVILESKTETTHRRRSGKNEALDEFQSSSHEPLIDLYTKNYKEGFRIRSGGFDFSSLAAEKTVLAAENLKRFVSKLVSLAPDAMVIDDYLSVRRALDVVWEPEIRKDTQGVQRSGLGKFNVNNVSIYSNLQQFTKYSRLQRHFL